jgi:hypothetical protein
MKTPPFPQRANVVTINGQAYNGTAAQIVKAMRADFRAEPTRTVAEFRERYAARALLWMKQPVRHDSDVAFLSDLEAVGLVQITNADAGAQ